MKDLIGFNTHYKLRQAAQNLGAKDVRREGKALACQK